MAAVLTTLSVLRVQNAKIKNEEVLPAAQKGVKQEGNELVYPLCGDAESDHLFRSPFAVESEILGPSVAQNNSDSKEGKTDKNQMNVPASHLITSLIRGHQNSLHHIETKLKELLQHQEVLSEGVQSENERFKTAETTFHLPALFQEISTYNQKLIQLKGEMTTIAERTSRLKKRAIRLQQQQQQKALNQEQERARQAEREKHLIARPVWATKEDDP